MTSNKSISNEDILELLQESIQMTTDGFDRLETRIGGLEGKVEGLEGRMEGLEGRMEGLEGRMEGLEGRMGSIENRMNQLEHQYTELKSTVDRIAGEQEAQTNDIKEILDRLLEIEKRLPNITELEIREMQTKLQSLVDWAIKAAKANNIPLNIPE